VGAPIPEDSKSMFPLLLFALESQCRHARLLGFISGRDCIPFSR
jgi:hypothetical protein